MRKSIILLFFCTLFAVFGPSQNITVQEAAHLTGLSEPTIWRLLKSGELTRVPMPKGRTGKPIRRTLINRDSVTALLGGQDG